MKGCLAPSEIPGIGDDYKAFGAVAEDLIWMDFCKTYQRISTEVFRDHNNPAAYHYFLVINNRNFTEAQQKAFFATLRSHRLGKGTLRRIPDFMVHKTAEKSFYEVKPNSSDGRADGAEKVGILRAVYPSFGLPYQAGSHFNPQNHTLCQVGRTLKVELVVERAADGLLLYKICLESEGVLDVVVIAALLRLIVREMNKQKGEKILKPVDLELVFRQNPQLEQLAKALGFAAVATAVAAVSWRYFWKAVAARFALRGAAAAGLAVADGPLPVGDLIALGIGLFTIIDIIRLSPELWRDAAVLAKQA